MTKKKAKKTNKNNNIKRFELRRREKLKVGADWFTHNHSCKKQHIRTYEGKKWRMFIKIQRARRVLVHAEWK